MVDVKLVLRNVWMQGTTRRTDKLFWILFVAGSLVVINKAFAVVSALQSVWLILRCCFRCYLVCNNFDSIISG